MNKYTVEKYECIHITQLEFFTLRDKLLSCGVKVIVVFSSHWESEHFSKAIAYARSGWIGFWLYVE